MVSWLLVLLFGPAIGVPLFFLTLADEHAWPRWLLGSLSPVKHLQPPCPSLGGWTACPSVPTAVSCLGWGAEFARPEALLSHRSQPYTHISVAHPPGPPPLAPGTFQRSPRHLPPTLPHPPSTFQPPPSHTPTSPSPWYPPTVRSLPPSSLPLPLNLTLSSKEHLTPYLSPYPALLPRRH